MTDKLDSFDRATLQGDSFDQLQQQSQLGQLQEAAPQAPIEEEVQPPSQEEQIELEQPVEQPLFSEKKNKDKPQEEAEPQEKEFTAGDYAGELAMSVPRGVEGAVEGVWNFFDFATGDRLWDFYDRKKYSWLGRPETGVGKAGEAIVQFATGFIPGVRLASWLGKASKLKGAAATLSKSKEAIKSFSKNQLSLSAKSMKNLSRLKSATKTNVKFATGGAISEFFVFKGEEQRLANLLATHESGGGPVQDVINWLAYDPDDENSNQLIERGKFALEGLIVGEVIGLGLLGVGKGYRAVRPKREVVEVTSESAIKAPEQGESVSALQKIFGVFARKNANIKRQLKEGEEVDEFKALNDALNDPELQVTPNEELALRESAHRNNDLKNATDWEEQTGEALSGSPRPRGVEGAIRETLAGLPSNKVKEINLKGDPFPTQTKAERAASRAMKENVRKRWDAKKEAAKKFNTDTATEKRLDEYFLSKGVTAANSTLQSKRAIAKDMMNESKAGGKEHLIETIEDHVAKTVKEAGLYDKTNPRAMASGVRVLNSVPEMRGFLLHASKVAMKASKQGKMSPKAQEKFYEETSKIANRGYEAAGGKGELDLSAFRGRTKDLELFRSEAETLYHALNGVAKDLKDKVASAEYALKNGTAKVQTQKGATVLNKDEAMTEVFSTMDRWTALQEIWADFGTQLSLGMRQRNDLYLTGQSALGRDIAGQHRTLGVALEDAMKKQGEIYRRQNRGNLSDKRIIKDLQKLFKNSGEVLDMNQVAKDFNQIGVNRGLSKWTLSGRKGLAVSQEWYYNAILGSPTSWAVNFLGGALVLPLRHIESISGGVMTGNVKLVKANFRTMFDVQSFKDSLKYAWKSGIDDEARSITGFTAFRDDRILKKGGEIRVDNADGTLLRSAFNFIGHVVRHPSRLMMVGDEFFKQMSYRARIKTSLAVDGYQKGLHREPGKLAEHIQNGFNTTITAKGRFRNEENIRREAVEALVAARKAGKDITDERKFINGYMKDHYDTNKLKRVKDVVYDDSIGFSQREALVEAGKDWALVNTFTNEVTNTFFKKTGEMAQMSPWMGFVIPFVRTPSNILLFALGRSIPRPIKLVKEMANVRKTKKNFEDFDAKTFADDAAKKADFGEMRQARENAQRYLNLIQNESGIKSAEAIGRLSTGILSTGALLMNIEALGERITGSPPSDPGKRAAWAATGKIPFAVQWGDKWHSYQRLDPFATTLGMMADISKGFSDMRDTGVSEFGDEEEFEEKKNEFFQVISIITTAIADNTMKKSYIENLGELLDVMEKPAESFEKVGGNILGGFVPNGLNWSQNVFEEEPAILEARGLLDKIRKRLPESMRPGGKIMPQRNAFGEIRRKSKDNTGDIRQEPLDLIKGLNPLFSSEISNDIVDIEIEHQAVGRKPMGDVRNIAGNRLSYRDYRNDKDQTAYDRMQELSGTVKLGPSQITLRQKLRRLIESNAYQRLPPITEKNKHRDHPRSKAITKVINSYRAEARRQTHREFKELRADLANLLR